MRNAELPGEVLHRHEAPIPIPHSALRIPHSVHGSKLSRNDDGLVTHAVTHTPHPTHPSGRSTGRPAASSAKARSPTGHTRAHTPHAAP